jgi:hypothetical protein
MVCGRARAAIDAHQDLVPLRRRGGKIAKNRCLDVNQRQRRVDA